MRVATNIAFKRWQPLPVLTEGLRQNLAPTVGGDACGPCRTSVRVTESRPRRLPSEGAPEASRNAAAESPVRKKLKSHD